MVTGTTGIALEVDTGSALLPVPVFLEPLTVTVAGFLVFAEAEKEATENMARKKLLMRMKRVIEKVL